MMYDVVAQARIPQGQVSQILNEALPIGGASSYSHLINK